MINKIFNVSETIVQNFAQITGDYSSLHMDEEFARKSKYRQRLVHGMLPFSFIAFLQQEFPSNQIKFLDFDTSFRQPIFLDDQIRLEITFSETENSHFEYQAVWYRNESEEILIKSKGNFCLSSLSEKQNNQDNIDNAKTCLVLDTLSENTYTIKEIADKTDGFNFSINTPLSQRYRDLILAEGLLFTNKDIPPLCNNLASTLLLSTLVGMKLPGRYATFAKFKFSFKEKVCTQDPLSLIGKVEKVSVASESIEITTTLSKNEEVLANGQLNVAINPTPKQTISCEEIKSNYLDMGLKDKVVVITGASRGIGAATAKLFAMHGAKVVVNYYKGKKDAELIVKEIETYGGIAIPLQCDIRDEKSVKEIIDNIVDKFGGINVLINNAVKEFTPKSYSKLNWNDYLSELEVSLKGMHNFCKEVVPILKQQKNGKIINLSTITVDVPVTGQNKYITVKSAVVGYTKSLAKELAGANIQVNLVSPNMTETDLVACIPIEFSKRLASAREYGRNLQPIEVAQSILFLASSWSDSITGQKIVLNLGEQPFC